MRGGANGACPRIGVSGAGAGASAAIAGLAAGAWSMSGMLVVVAAVGVPRKVTGRTSFFLTFEREGC